MVSDCNDIYCEHFITDIIVQSLSCTPETNIIYYITILVSKNNKFLYNENVTK